MKIKIKQKWKNLFWLIIGIILLVINYVRNTSIVLKTIFAIFLIIFILGILSILIISEKNQPKIKKPISPPININFS